MAGSQTSPVDQHAGVLNPMPDAPDLTGVTAAPTASSTLQLLSPILETHLLPRLTLADIQNLEWVYRAAKETFLEDEDLLRIVQAHFPPALGWTQACEFRQQLQCTSQMQQALRAGQLQVTKQVDCHKTVYLETAQLSPCGGCVAAMGRTATTFHLLDDPVQALKPPENEDGWEVARTCGGWSHSGRLFAQARCHPSGDTGMHISLSVHDWATGVHMHCSGPDVLQPPSCVWAVGDIKFSPDDEKLAVVCRKGTPGPQLLHVFRADCTMVSHHLLRAFLDWQWLPDSCQLLLAHSDQLTTLHMAAAQPSPESQQPQLPPGEAQPSPVLLEVSPGGIVAALFCSQEHCQLFLVDGSSGRQLHASRHAGGRGLEAEYEQNLGLALTSHAVAFSAFSPYRQGSLEPSTIVLAHRKGQQGATPMFECIGKWPSWSPDGSVLATIRGALVHLVHGITGALIQTWSPYCHVPASWRISCRTLGVGRVQPVAWRERGMVLHISAPALLPADHGAGTGTVIWVVQLG